MASPTSLGTLVLVLYLGMMAWHGLRGAKASKTVSDYHVAGRRLGGLVVGLSFYASFTSTNSFLGLAGRSWDWGLGTWLMGAIFIAFAWLSWRVVGEPLRLATGRLGVVSLPEYFGRAFGSPLYRRVAALVIVAASIPFLQAVFKGSALVMMQLTGLEMAPALALVWVVVVAYTVAGGFHAVAHTDAVQGVIMLVAAVSLPVALIWRGGGVAGLLASVGEHAGPATNLWGMGPLGMLIGIGLAGGFKMLSEPRQVSRYLAVDVAGIAQARRVSFWALALTYLLILPVGLLARPFLVGRPGDLDTVVPSLLSRPDLVPPVMGALFMAAFLAAAMSSIDSVLLVVGAAIQRDLLGWEGGRGPLTELAATRLWIVLYSLVPASLVVILPGGIIELTTLSGGIYGAAFIPPLLFSLHAKRTSLPGAISCLLLGGATVFLWKSAVVAALPALAPVHEVVAGGVVSLVVYALCHLLWPRRMPVP